MKTYKIAVSTDNKRTFATNSLEFTDKKEAIRHGDRLMFRWLAVTDLEIYDTSEKKLINFKLLNIK